MNRELSDVQARIRKADEPEIKLLAPVGSQKKQGNSRKASTFVSLTKAFVCGSQQTVENSSRDGKARPRYLIPEKPVCRTRSNS